MKKTIFILFMALFAFGTTQIFAQSVFPILDPTPLGDCFDLDDPLNVVPGQEYTYSVNVPTPPGNKTYHWYVTQDVNFIASGVLNNATALPIGGPILAAGSAWYNDPTDPGSGPSINLTWQSFNLATDQYVFVVIYVVNDGSVVGGDDCVTDNLKVYRIKPLHAFTLTIANIDGAAFNTGIAEVCVDDVQSAVYDPLYNLGEGGVVYDFGQNEFYYAVAAANFSGPFQITAQLAGLQGPTPYGDEGQIAAILWDTDLTALQAATGGVAIEATPVTPWVITPPAGVSYGQGEGEGFVFYLKIIMQHQHFEATDPAGYDYTIALDATLPDGSGVYGPHTNDNLFGDLSQVTCVRDAFGVHNQATQQLRPRPDIQSTTGTPPGDSEFLPIAPTP